MQGQKMVYKSFVSSPFCRRYRQKIQSVYKERSYRVQEHCLRNGAAQSGGKRTGFSVRFEESLGYLYGNYTRDKDGILATQMICLIAAWLKTQDKTLYDRLEDLYREFGYAESRATAIEFHAEKTGRR